MSLLLFEKEAVMWVAQEEKHKKKGKETEKKVETRCWHTSTR